jgi:hypothetical protein
MASESQSKNSARERKDSVSQDNGSIVIKCLSHGTLRLQYDSTTANSQVDDDVEAIERAKSRTVDYVWWSGGNDRGISAGQTHILTVAIAKIDRITCMKPCMSRFLPQEKASASQRITLTCFEAGDHRSTLPPYPRECSAGLRHGLNEVELVFATVVSVEPGLMFCSFGSP